MAAVSGMNEVTVLRERIDVWVICQRAKIKTNIEEWKDRNHIQHFVVSWVNITLYGKHVEAINTAKLAQSSTFHIFFMQNAAFDHNFVITKKKWLELLIRVRKKRVSWQ